MGMQRQPDPARSTTLILGPWRQSNHAGPQGTGPSRRPRGRTPPPLNRTHDHRLRPTGPAGSLPDRTGARARRSLRSILERPPACQPPCARAVPGPPVWPPLPALDSPGVLSVRRLTFWTTFGRIGHILDTFYVELYGKARGGRSSHQTLKPERRKAGPGPRCRPCYWMRSFWQLQTLACRRQGRPGDPSRLLLPLVMRMPPVPSALPRLGRHSTGMTSGLAPAPDIAGVPALTRLLASAAALLLHGWASQPIWNS